MQSQGGNKEISLQCYYSIYERKCQVENIFGKFREAISRVNNLVEEIDSSKERHIRLMQIYTIDLLNHIAENIRYCDWADRDEEARQEDIIATLDGYKHELIKPLLKG